MAFLVSPGVQVNEVDLTNVVPAIQTTIGAFAGVFERGPVLEVTNISSEEQLVKIFGKPNGDNFEGWFTCSNFLQYSDSLKIVRANTGMASANAGSNATLKIQNTDDYLERLSPINGGNSDNFGEWASRVPGKIGNSVGVSVCFTSTAFEETAKSTTSGDASLGATSVTLASNSGFNVRDIVNFGETDGHEYEVTAVHGSNNSITFRLKDDVNSQGLQSAVSSGTNVRRRWRWYDLFDEAPGTSEFATQNGRGTADEMHIAVFDTTGDISGFDADQPGERLNAVLETFKAVSKNNKGKTPQGKNNFYADVVYNDSEYIYWMDHNTNDNDTFGTDLDGGDGNIILNASDSSSSDSGDDLLLEDGASDASGDSIALESGAQQYAQIDTPTNNSLSAGADDYAVTAAQLATAYDLFQDAESNDVNFVLGGPGDGHLGYANESNTSRLVDTNSAGDTHGTMITTLVEKRRDCVGFVSARRKAVVNVANSVTQTSNVKSFFDQLPSSSYMVFDSGYKYMYDKYNDVYRFVPLNGDIAGLCSFTDRVADSWFSPGGFTRGNIRGAIKLAYNPTKPDRDILYRARVNPVVNFPGQGVVLFGDKTALTKPSAFDRINVRRLFLTLEKAIATAAKFQLFEFNDEFTRAQFRSLVEPFLRDVQGRRGITDFSVVCDASNNTGEVIDRNEFVADIFVKPARAINFISLNFIATRTGVAFSEVGG